MPTQWKNWKQKAATGEIMIGCATIESSKGLSCTDAESATYRNQFPTMTLITSIEYKQLHLFSTYVIRMAGRYAERLIWWLNAEIRHEQQKNLKRASREPTHFFRRINLCNFTKQYRMRSWPPMCQRKERSNAECQIHVLTTKSPVWGCEQYSVTVFKYSTSNYINLQENDQITIFHRSVTQLTSTRHIVFLIIRDSCDRTFCEIKKIVNQMTLNGILDCIRSVQ